MRCRTRVVRAEGVARPHKLSSTFWKTTGSDGNRSGFTSNRGNTCEYSANFTFTTHGSHTLPLAFTIELPVSHPGCHTVRGTNPPGALPLWQTTRHRNLVRVRAVVNHCASQMYSSSTKPKTVTGGAGPIARGVATSSTPTDTAYTSTY